MAATRSQFAALLYPGLRDVLFDKYDKYPRQFEKIFKLKDTSRPFEVVQGVTGFPTVPVKPEGLPIQYADPVQGYNKTYVPIQYGLGYRITERMYKDDQYGVMGDRMSKMLGKSANITKETLAAAIFNNGFSDVGPDGVSLFNAQHPLAAAYASYGNRPSVDAALGQTSLESLMTQVRLTVDDENLLIMIRPECLIVHPNNEFYALELLKSTLKPDSTNNNINAVQNTLDLVVWDFLTNANAWFLTTSKDDHNLMWYDREPLEFDSADDFDTGDAKYKATFNVVAGYDDWRGVAGTS